VFVELIDALRCPRVHEPTWLVAAAHDTRARCVVAGTLGCPVCRATYAVAGGVARFDQALSPPAAPPLADPAGDALRLAALLGLTDAGGIVAVGGSWDAAVDPLLDAVAGAADVRVLVIEPAGAYAPRPPVGALAGAWLPVAPGALRGVALDAATATPDRLAAAVAALRPRGRLVAPAAAPLPDGVHELARDARHWVAERETGPAMAGPVVALRRAGR
jgi:uncharacterized protein YbaR (Trm112 family)